MKFRRLILIFCIVQGACAESDGTGDEPLGDVIASKTSRLARLSSSKDPTGDECPSDERKRLPGVCGCGKVDLDTDGDGIADCEDQQKRQGHDYSADSIIPRENVVRSEHLKSVFAATPDSRLYFGVQSFTDVSDRGGERQSYYDYVVTLLRPESVTDFGDGPNFDGAFAPRVIVEAPHGKVPGKMHHSVFYDPGFVINPYPSNAAGSFAADGGFKTYRLGIFGVKRYQLGQRFETHLTLTSATIIVGEPDTPRAFIHSARIDSPPKALTTRSGAYLNRFEPSASVDGRLVIWNGYYGNRRTPGSAGVINASFNPEPMEANGWSEPRSIVDLYYDFGPGAEEELIVDGVPFSQRYPIAAEPMRGPDGKVLPRGTHLPGAYPWLSFDASEAFFPTVATFDGPKRSAVAAIGQRTGYGLVHLDGLINPSRSEVMSTGPGQPVRYPGTGVESAMLAHAYQNHSLGDGSPLPKRGYHRIFSVPVSLTGSMWHPLNGQATAMTSSLSRRQTRLQHPGVYGLFLSHSLRYVEVDLHAQEDGQYLLFAPMNERLDLDTESLRSLHHGRFEGRGRLGMARQAVSHSKSHSVDLSGHFNQIRLRGAAFPYEAHRVRETWNEWWSEQSERVRLGFDPRNQIQGCTGDEPPERCLTNEEMASLRSSLPANILHGDRIEGIFGNAVLFSSGDFIEVDFKASARRRLTDADALTISFWVKPVSLFSGSLMSVGNLEVLVHGTTIRVEGASSSALRAPRALHLNQWTHVALRMNQDKAELWINGQFVQREQATWNVEGVSKMNFGPQGVVGTDETIALMDEVRLSDAYRNRRELAHAAFIDRRPLPTGENELELEQYHPDRAKALDTVERNRITRLGEDLFFSSALSSDPKMSCGTCHMRERRFTDGFDTAVGAFGHTGERSTPVVFNRDASTVQLADGRAATLESQALMPIALDAEMGIALEDALWQVDEVFGERFERIFARQTNRSDLAFALATYMRSLRSYDSDFDIDELTRNARRGQSLFFGKARCSTCHAGPNFTDERFHAIGLTTNRNEGLTEQTSRHSDRGKTKTPTLREIAHTGPYFRDGSAKNLRSVVAFYNRGGHADEPRDFAIRPLGLSRREQRDLVAFLASLSGRTLPTGSKRITAMPIDIIAGKHSVQASVIGRGFDEMATIELRTRGRNPKTKKISSGDVTFEAGVTVEGLPGTWNQLQFAMPGKFVRERHVQVIIKSNGGRSKPFTLTRDSRAAPNTPELTEIRTLNSGKIRLSWQYDQIGETHFQVRRRIKRKAWKDAVIVARDVRGNQRRYVDDPPMARQYGYSIRAINNEVKSKWSGWFNVGPTAVDSQSDVQGLKAPSITELKHQSNGRVRIEWSDTNMGDRRFQVRRRIRKNGAWRPPKILTRNLRRSIRRYRDVPPSAQSYQYSVGVSHGEGQLKWSRWKPLRSFTRR